MNILSKQTAMVALAATMMAALPDKDAGAASLGLATTTPSIAADAATVEVILFGSLSELFTFDAEVTSIRGFTPTGDVTLSLAIGFDEADPLGTASGGFDVFDDNGEVLAGDLVAVGFGDSALEFEFGLLSGGNAGLFGSTVLMTVLFDDPLGTDPFGALFDGAALDASITVENVVSAVVPAPLSLPLLATALAGLVGARRFSRRAGAAPG